jgi:hypothetical protein
MIAINQSSPNRIKLSYIETVKNSNGNLLIILENFICYFKKLQLPKIFSGIKNKEKEYIICLYPGQKGA